MDQTVVGVDVYNFITNQFRGFSVCVCVCVCYEGGDITLVETRAGVLVDLASGNCYDLPQPSLSGELS